MTSFLKDDPAPAPLPTTFRDALGREWRVRITAGQLGRVRREAGVALGDLMRDPAALGEFLYADPETLGRIVWLLVADQADARGVTPEQFADAFDGSTLQESTDAVLGAVADFFPRSPVAAQMRRGLAAMLTAMDLASVAAMERATGAVTTSISNGSAGSSPGPSASTPGPTPSAS